jgi:hypothetical protein
MDGTMESTADTEAPGLWRFLAPPNCRYLGLPKQQAADLSREDFR